MEVDLDSPPPLPESIFDTEPEGRSRAWFKDAPPDAKPWDGSTLVVLTAITLLAGVLRLFHLGQWSFWIDEAHTIRDALLLPLDEFLHSSRGRYPLGFLLIRWLWPLMPSLGEGYFRLPFAFFGIASIPLMAVVVRRFLGRGPALVSALILCLSPWHIYWSQNCRVYALVLFLSLGAIGLFQVGVERGDARLLLSSLLVSLLSGLSHPSGLFLVPAFVVYLACFKLGVARAPEAFGLKTALAYLVPLVLAGLFAVLFFWKTLLVFQRAKGGESFFHLVNTTVFYIRVPVLVAALGGVFLTWRLRTRSGLLLSLLIVVPFAEASIASLFMKATAQYLFFTLPAWFALAGFGAYEITRSLKAEGFGRIFLRALPLAMLLLDLAAEDHLYFNYRYGDRPRWREAADYLDLHAGRSDFIASSNQPSLEWYLNPNDPQLGILQVQHPGRRRVEQLADWKLDRLPEWTMRAEAEGTRVWLVLTEPEFYEWDRDKRWDTWIRARFHQVKRLPNWTGPKDMTILIYRFDPKPPPGGTPAKR